MQEELVKVRIQKREMTLYAVTEPELETLNENHLFQTLLASLFFSGIGIIFSNSRGSVEFSIGLTIVIIAILITAIFRKKILFNKNYHKSFSSVTTNKLVIDGKTAEGTISLKELETAGLNEEEIQLFSELLGDNLIRD